MTIAVFAAVRRDMQEGRHVPGSLAAYRPAGRQALDRRVDRRMEILSTGKAIRDRY